MRDLLLATTNMHKLEEYHSIFSDIPFRLLSLRDVQLDIDVEETGTTFAENAQLKALAYASASGMLALADDSGLEIDALGGVPGIYSARFAGVSTSYAERFRLLLGQLQGLPMSQRTARFRCAIAIGFGYDPIFLIPEAGKTTAELLPEEKNRISHRGRAAQLAAALLRSWPE